MTNWRKYQLLWSVSLGANVLVWGLLLAGENFKGNEFSGILWLIVNFLPALLLLIAAWFIPHHFEWRLDYRFRRLFYLTLLFGLICLLTLYSRNFNDYVGFIRNIRIQPWATLPLQLWLLRDLYVNYRISRLSLGGQLLPISDEHKAQVRIAIGDGRMMEAIDQLLRQLSDEQYYFKKKILLLRNNYKTFENAYNSNTIGFQEFSQMKAKIANELLGMV